MAFVPLACAGGELPEAIGPPQPLFPAAYYTDHAEFQSFDWSSDGRRLAISLARWVANDGGGLVYEPELWIADLNYSAGGGAEQTTFAGLRHFPESSVRYPSWAPSVPAAACDRIAFSRGGSIWLIDVPREGFQAGDCDIGAPTAIGGTAAAALDWK